MTENRLILPGDPQQQPPAGGVVLTCQKCGKDMPPLPEDLAKMMKSAGGVTLAHDVCPGETPQRPEGRYFEVRCQIVEVTEEQTGSSLGSDVTPTVNTEELVSFRSGVRAASLNDAMRPLAEALGEKWMAAEKQAHIADGGVG